MTIKLGVVGTSWITSQFIEAAQSQSKFELTAVFSRHQESGNKIIQKFGRGDVYTDFSEFLASDCEVVYIASPNSLHFKQTKKALLKHKSVICEKPAVIEPDELFEIKQILNSQPDLFFFEAERNLYDPKMQLITDLKREIGQITGASITYMKRSSRFAEIEKGKLPNVFSTDFAGGALEDLGVYAIHFAIAQFGKPDRAFYNAKKLEIEHGSDIFGLGLLEYSNFAVEIKIGKSANSYAPTEIYGEKGTILVSNPADLDAISIDRNNNELKEIPTKKKENPLVYETEFFYNVLLRQDRNIMFKQLSQSKIVHQVLKEMRECAGLMFK